MIAIDIKMPESCLSCPLENDFNECSVYMGLFSKSDPYYCTYEYSNCRPDWCPLLHVDKVLSEHVVSEEDIQRFDKDEVFRYAKLESGKKIAKLIAESDNYTTWSDNIDVDFDQSLHCIRGVSYVVKTGELKNCQKKE